MILPGDILWDRYRVARVETERVGCAWLTPLASAGGAGSAAGCLLLSLGAPGRMALADFLASLWPGILPAAGAPGDGRVAVPLLGMVEWRGVPESGGVALVEGVPANALSNLVRSDAAGGIGAEPGNALRLVANFAAGLERMLHCAAAKPGGAREFCRAGAALLNPKSVGLTADGSRLVILPAAGPAESAGTSALVPPYWTLYAAPEVIAGGPACGEPALVFGLAQVALSLLFAPLTAEMIPTPPFTHGWQRLAVQDIALKELKRDPRTASLPKPVVALLAKCLRAPMDKRFASLAKLRAALKKLARGDEAAGKSALLAIPSAAQDKAVEIPPGMTVVAAGPYLSGEKKAPRTLRAFAIDVTPVTERDYREYLKAVHREPAAGGPGARPLKYDKHPVVNITWREAEEYAAHYGKRLPTIYEWEKAARGKDGRKFPYGNEYTAGTGKLRASGATPAAGKEGKEGAKESAPVGSFPKGASPFGVLDMAGNVLEWTSTARRQGERIFRALKGACFLDGSVELSRCAAIQYKKPEAREANVGFRCVMDLGVGEQGLETGGSQGAGGVI